MAYSSRPVRDDLHPQPERNQTVKLSLDPQALEALFPPGSDARIELSRAVVAAIVGKMALKDVKELDAKLAMQAKRAVSDTIGAHFGVSAWGNVELPSKVKQAIYDEVNRQGSELISAQAKAFWDDSTGKLADRIASAIEYKTGLGLKPIIKDCVREVLKEGLK
jgi:hypothetical protein